MGRELFFPTNPDLANILGDTDFDFENLYFSDCLDPIFLADGKIGLTWPQMKPGAVVSY